MTETKNYRTVQPYFNIKYAYSHGEHCKLALSAAVEAIHSLQGSEHSHSAQTFIAPLSQNEAISGSLWSSLSISDGISLIC